MGWIAGAAAIGSALMANSGQNSANRMNRQEAQENRKFQERMSNTAHQRETVDLEAAGLNRILGYSKGSGGASTPSGDKAIHQNSMALASQHIAKGGLAVAQANNLDANTAKTIEETKIIAPKALVYHELLTLAKDVKTWLTKPPGTGGGLSAKAKGTMEQIGINLGITTKEVEKMMLQKFKNFKGTNKELAKAFDAFIQRLKNQTPRGIQIKENK